MKIATKFPAIEFAVSKCIYTLNKQYLNGQTMSGIKYCGLRGVSGKASNSNNLTRVTQLSACRNDCK